MCGCRTFTTNVVKAAPVKWDQNQVYHKPFAQAVVCNSGVANACTGEEGYAYCRMTAEIAAGVLGIPEDSVLVASTGVIGAQLPMTNLAQGIEKLVPVLSGFAGGGNTGGSGDYDDGYCQERNGGYV